MSYVLLGFLPDVSFFLVIAFIPYLLFSLHLPFHTNRNEGPDGDKDGDVLHGVHHRTPARRPDPPTEDKVGVSERDAEESHADVGEGEVA